jgi:biofilm PGA synthesis N-glycosyltransferase PgaC
MTAFFISVFAIYFLFLILLIVGWNKSSPLLNKESPALFISVIIPFRNEEKNIPILIETLQALDYPKEKFEVTLIDDHSTDNSLKVAGQAIANLPNFKVITSPSNGKKNAIRFGVEVSKGEIIVTTDADCELPIEWLKSINMQFQNQSIKMVVGAVCIRTGSSFFSRLQAIEFSSLIGSAASTLAVGLPTMCNGANLSYRKESFEEVEGFEGNEHIASGDDEFLMRKIVKKFGSQSLIFLKNPNAIVTTNPKASLSHFFNQRIRWAGKWRHSSSGTTKMLAVFVLLLQLLWLVAVCSLFFRPWDNTVLVLLAVKLILEGFFLYAISRFMRQNFYWNAFLLLQVVHPLYVLLVGILSNVVRPSWKGRSI